MVILKRAVPLSLIVSIGLSIQANASLEGFIKNNVGASITTENAGYYKTQSRGYYTLGSMRARWDGLGRVHPFNMQAPSMNVGCSGIDMVFGGFSYLNFEYIIEKLKKISAAAPAFAFKMALSTLCKDCDTIMTELEKIANAINNMNFDTCQIAQSAVNWAGEQIGKMASDTIGFGKQESWLSSHTTAIEDASSTIQGWINGAGEFMNKGVEGAKENLLQGSLIKRASDTYGTIFGNGEEWEALTRTIVGDVVGYTLETQKTDGTKDTTLKVDIVQPSIDNAKFIEALLEGGEINAMGLKQIEDKKRHLHYKPTYPDMKIKIPQGGLKKIVKDKIITLVEKIRANENLNENDKNFINSVSVPIYRIVSVMSIVGDSGIEKTAEFLALVQVEALIRKMNDEMARYVSAYKREKGIKTLSDEDVKKVRQIIGNAGKNRQEVNELLIKASADFAKQMSLLDHYVNLEKAIREKSPLWSVSGFGD